MLTSKESGWGWWHGTDFNRQCEKTWHIALMGWNLCHGLESLSSVCKIKHILSVIHYTKCGTVCFQFTRFLCDDWENIYTLTYYHHQIGVTNYYPLFRVRSWNNGMRCMSLYILMGKFFLLWEYSRRIIHNVWWIPKCQLQRFGSTFDIYVYWWHKKGLSCPLPIRTTMDSFIILDWIWECGWWFDLRCRRLALYVTVP